MDPDSEKEIHSEIASLFAKCGLLPSTSQLEQRGLTWQEVLLRLIADYCQCWAEFLAHVKRTAAPMYDERQLTEWVLRLVVVDASFRLAAAMVLLSHQPPGDGVPAWAKKGSRPHCLRQIQLELGPAGPSLEELAEKAEVSPNILDEWRAGTSRPYDRNLEHLAAALSHFHPSAGASELAGRLRRHYFLSDLCDLLASQIGRETVQEMAETLTRLTARVMTKLGPTEPFARSPGTTAIVSLLLHGPRSNVALDLVRDLGSEERDPQWREALLSSTEHVGWVPYLQDKAYLMAADIGNPEPLEHDGDGPPDFREYEHWFTENVAGLREALALGDTEAALRRILDDLADLRGRIARNPGSAEYHWALGTRLGLYGCRSGIGEWAEEGILECRVAAQLDQTWDVPLLEIGIIRMRQGRFDEAKRELEAAVTRFGKTTASLAFNLAQARMFCGEFEGAIGLFEQVLQEVPDFAAALDYLAFCCVKSGKLRKGKQVAREARHLGSSWTYDAMERGALAEHPVPNA